MQYAPPRLPSRGSASIQRRSKAVAANSPSSRLKVENLSTMNFRAADQVNFVSDEPIGANRSHHGSCFFPSLAALAFK